MPCMCGGIYLLSPAINSPLPFIEKDMFGRVSRFPASTYIIRSDHRRILLADLWALNFNP